MNTKLEAVAAIAKLRPFIGPQQLRCLEDGCRGEEQQFFIEKLCELAGVVETMPKTYEQEGVDDPVVHLHYFYRAANWYITERDIDGDGGGQLQAFGFANLGDDQNAEIGYISIAELIEEGVELDLHFAARPLSACKRRKAA